MKKSLMIALLITGIASSWSYADLASHRMKARELLEVMNTKEQVSQLLRTYEGMVKQEFDRANLSAEGHKASVGHQRGIMDWFSKYVSWGKLEGIYVDIYADAFTENELEELIQFYQSSIGKKLLEKTPELIQRSMEKVQADILNKTQEFQERIHKAKAELEEKYGDA